MELIQCFSHIIIYLASTGSLSLSKKNSLPNMSREIKGPLHTGYPYNIDTNCFLKAGLIIVKGIWLFA